MGPATRSESEQRDSVYWEEQRRWVAESRSAQGLPPTVRDRQVLELVAAAIRTARKDSPR